MSATSKPQGKAMYMAPKLDKSWLLNVQKKLYAQSLGGKGHPALRSQMESPVHNERCTPGSERGARRPLGVSRERRRAPTLRASMQKEDPMT